MSPWQRLTKTAEERLKLKLEDVEPALVFAGVLAHALVLVPVPELVLELAPGQLQYADLYVGLTRLAWQPLFEGGMVVGGLASALALVSVAEKALAGVLSQKQ